MEKTKNERNQLQENIDSMELELRQVQEEIQEVTRQNEQVTGKCDIFIGALRIVNQVW